MNDKLKTFISGAIPGYFTGLYFLFDNIPVGSIAVVTFLLKTFMAFTLAVATGMGTIVAKHLAKKINEKIQQRKNKKDGKHNDSRAA